MTPSADFYILTIMRGVVLPLFGRASLLLLVAVFAGAAPGGAAAAAKPAVNRGVRQTVKSGTAKVLVELRISGLKPEGELKPESVKAQRQARGNDRHRPHLADGATPRRPLRALTGRVRLRRRPAE